MIFTAAKIIYLNLRIVRFWFDARKSHFDSLVGEHDAAVFGAAGALVEAVLVKAVLTVVARVRARRAFVDVDACLGRFDVLVAARTDADEITF